MSKTKVKIKRTLDVLYKVAALAISILTVFPQLNPYNSDYHARANAGDVHAQVVLAHHYFMSSNYDDSAYWYRIIAEGNSFYKGLAINNLCYIYLTSNNTNIKTVTFYDDILTDLKTAYESGEISAAQNIYFLLSLHHESCFYEHDRQWELENIVAYLKDHNLYIQTNDYFYSKFSPADTMIGDINTHYWPNSGNFWYIDEEDNIYYVTKILSGKSESIGNCNMTVEYTIYEKTTDDSQVFYYINPFKTVQIDSI